MQRTHHTWPGGRSSAAGLVLTLLLLTAPGPRPSAAAAPRAGAVTVVPGIPYRHATTWDDQPVELTLDRYQPPPGTPVRGAVVWIHGGGFVEGAQDDPADVAIATRLAEHGYVTASIGYRLGPVGGSSEELDDPDVLGRIIRAYDDARAALRFVRDHAADWGFDPDRVFAAGASAGGGTALNLAYLPAHHTDPASPFRVAGAVSLIARTEPSLIEPGEAPMLMINGTEDTTVPLSSAQATCDAARAVAVPCDLITYEMGHGDPALFEPIMADVTTWLDARVDALDAAETLPSTTAPAPAAPTPAAGAVPVAGRADFTG